MEGVQVIDEPPPLSLRIHDLSELEVTAREARAQRYLQSEAHLRQTLKVWVTHYNCGRPHSALGPGVPDPPAGSSVPLSPFRHRLGDFRSVHAEAILGGLHHEYSLARA